MEKLLNQSESFYRIINEVISKGDIPLLDKAYPNHDGKEDAQVIAEMMSLRDTLHGIIYGCKVMNEMLSRILDKEKDEA